MENVLKTLERKNPWNMMFNLQFSPQITLPKYWWGFKKRPNNTTLSAWREAFSLERDLLSNELDRNNFNRLLKLVDIAEECGATNLNFKMNFENGNKSLALFAIQFPTEKVQAMTNEFLKRLKEIC